MIRRSLIGLTVLVMALVAGQSFAAAQDNGTDDGYEVPVVVVDGEVADIVDAPRAAPAPAPAAPTPAPAALPRTGSDIAVPLTVAGIAIALGGAALITSRRRKAAASL